MPPTRHSCGAKGMRSFAVSFPKASALIPLANTHGAKLSVRMALAVAMDRLDMSLPEVARPIVLELAAKCRANAAMDRASDPLSTARRAWHPEHAVGDPGHLRR